MASDGVSEGLREEDIAQFEVDMLTVCYMYEKMPYAQAVESARREHKEIKLMELKRGL
jgi:hypothetical protein